MRKRWMIIGIFSIALALSFIFDRMIIRSFSEIRNKFLDEFFLGLTFISSEIIIFFFLTSLFLWKEHKRRWILPLWLTLFLNALISFVLKISIKRQRPFQEEIVSIPDILISNSHILWNFSLPSFQTMLVFCAIPVISKEFPRIKWAWIFFACLVGLSRAYFGLHYLSDVIAGGLIGYFIGILIIKLESKKRWGEKIYRKFFR